MTTPAIAPTSVLDERGEGGFAVDDADVEVKDAEAVELNPTVQEENHGA